MGAWLRGLRSATLCARASGAGGMAGAASPSESLSPPPIAHPHPLLLQSFRPGGPANEHATGCSGHHLSQRIAGRREP